MLVFVFYPRRKSVDFLFYFFSLFIPNLFISSEAAITLNAIAYRYIQ